FAGIRLSGQIFLDLRDCNSFPCFSRLRINPKLALFFSLKKGRSNEPPLNQSTTKPYLLTSIIMLTSIFSVKTPVTFSWLISFFPYFRLFCFPGCFLFRIENSLEFLLLGYTVSPHFFPLGLRLLGSFGGAFKV